MYNPHLAANGRLIVRTSKYQPIVASGKLNIRCDFKNFNKVTRALFINRSMAGFCRNDFDGLDKRRRVQFACS